MNILFYLEPLREWHKPVWKIDWLKTFEKRIYETLEKSSLRGSIDYAICLDESYDYVDEIPEAFQKFFLTQREVLEPFPEGYLDASTRWHNGNWTKEAMAHYHELLTKKLRGFIPDIIITHTPAPHLHIIFPEALLFHMEVSIFSRPPYPLSFYLDPIGMIGNSFLTLFGPDIKNTEITQQHALIIQDIRAAARKVFLESSPFKTLTASFRKRFKHLILLPLQVSGFYAFDALAPHSSQIEYIEFILNGIPEDIGVIVTSHPADNSMDDYTLKYLARRYPNFIFDPSFDEYFCSSQYLVAEADGVITYSSSLGVQTLFWGNKLICLGKGFYEFIADATSLDKIQNVLESPKQYKDNILYWLLTRYTIMDQHLCNPEWLAAFLTRSRAKYRRHGITSRFFDEIAPIETIREIVMNALKEAQPEKALTPNNPQLLRNKIMEMVGALKNKSDYIALLEDWKRKTEELIQKKDSYIKRLEDWKENAERELKKKNDTIESLRANRN